MIQYTASVNFMKLQLNLYIKRTYKAQENQTKQKCGMKVKLVKVPSIEVSTTDFKCSRN